MNLQLYLELQIQVMERWCRLFRRTHLDWADLVARRYASKHPR